MTYDLLLANAQLILKDSVLRGAVGIKDGVIQTIEPGTEVPKGAADLGGDYLAPGLVELHTDNLERHMSPRPKVHWPHRPAILAHDRELAATGITTVFDAIRVGSILTEGHRRLGRYARSVADDIASIRAAGMLKISHHIHLRAELCSETLIEELGEFATDDRVGIVSMMDHTPGQRQFRDLEKYRTYTSGKHGFTPAALDAHIVFLRDLQQRCGAQHEAAAVAAAQRFGATLASHDDTTPAHVTRSHENGVTLAEFPTTVAAAQTCHSHGIATIMGAPNIVRGGSHSGNVAALDLAKMDLLDILSSDYVPAGLLTAAVTLGQLWDDMPRAMATVSGTPARAVGLHDRGALEVGLRADLIRFSVPEPDVVLKQVWAQGHQVG